MRRALSFILFFVLIFLTACSGSPEIPPTATPQEAAVVEATAEPTAEPTPVPDRTLVVCVGNEPETLYLYGGSSSSMWSILEAVYDGPFDYLDYEARPVIFEAMPTVDNGGVVYESVMLTEGDLVLNAAGELVSLAEGTLIFPAGCRGADCAVNWYRGDEVQMERMKARFQLLPGLTWSDGAPLTAADSVFSFNVASDPATPVSRTVLDRTASYLALDEQIVEWTGIPGYFPRVLTSLFWLPLPAHQLEIYAAEELLLLPETTQQPLGWGPYVIESWERGDHLTLRRNEQYARAAEGLPAFDKLVFRFLDSTPDVYLQSLLIGECDVVDRTAGLDAVQQDVRIAEIDGKLTMYDRQGPEWEQLVMGIQPASYDEEYNIYQGDRPDFFGDVRARQALALCANRQEIISRYLYDKSSVPVSYLLPEHPAYLDGGEAAGYDLEAGKALLTEAGWIEDGNGGRVSQGVPGVLNGTPLTLSLLAPDSHLNQRVVEVLSASFAECGIQVEPTLMDAAELYAPGPEGLVFGRQFDLALISWMAGLEPPCALYLSEQIPSEENYWLGMNVSGYHSEAFDAACRAGRAARVGEEEVYLSAHQEAQQIFINDLPTIPLYYRLKIAASRPDLCGFEMDISARSDLWNLENWEIDESCTGKKS
ncbi:MAG: hypothetical protein JW750_05110 [Anaerolineaceae bacterium]|nr:hypothetical protein [Anaerolineaceae bacterium]